IKPEDQARGSRRESAQGCPGNAQGNSQGNIKGTPRDAALHSARSALACQSDAPTTRVQNVLNSVRGSCTRAIPMCSTSPNSKFLVGPGLACQPLMPSSRLA